MLLQTPFSFWIRLAPSPAAVQSFPNNCPAHGDMEIPLTDEGYEFRQPTQISLKKGWNTVLIKARVAGFKGPDWHNPVKWMLTFVPVPESSPDLKQ